LALARTGHGEGRASCVGTRPEIASIFGIAPFEAVRRGPLTRRRDLFPPARYDLHNSPGNMTPGHPRLRIGRTPLMLYVHLRPAPPGRMGAYRSVAYPSIDRPSVSPGPAYFSRAPVPPFRHVPCLVGVLSQAIATRQQSGPWNTKPVDNRDYQ